MKVKFVFNLLDKTAILEQQKLKVASIRSRNGPKL